MPDCSKIPKDKALKAARLTAETGNEHGFVFCKDGSAGEIQEGGKKKMTIEGGCESGKAGIFHTHPNDVIHLSDQDRETLGIDEIGSVCAGDTDGNVKCEFDGREQSCVRDLSVQAPEPDDAALIEQVGSVTVAEPECPFTAIDGDYEVELLPKGSTCKDWKSVPSRSEYHDSDSVDRCADYMTGPDDSGSDPDDSDDGGESVAGWESVEPQDDEIARWEASIDHTFRGSVDGEVFVKPYQTSRGGDDQDPHIYVANIGDESERRKVVKDEDVAIESAEQWMQENPLSSFEIDVPDDVNGWDRVMFNESGEHRKHRTVWERWRKPNARFPERRKEQVEIHKRASGKTGKWTTRYRYTDSDGEDLDNKPRKLPNLPSKSSMTGRSKEKKNHWKDPDKPLSLLREYMEDNAPEKADWSEVPSFDVTTKNRNLKPIADLWKRVAPDTITTDGELTGIEVTNSTVEVTGTDETGRRAVGMFDISMSVAGFETDKHNRDAWKDSRAETGKAAFDAYTVGDYLTDKKMSDEVNIRVHSSQGTNEPPMLVIDQGEVSVPLWDSYGSATPDLPDVEYEASARITDASQLKKAGKIAENTQNTTGDEGASGVISLSENRVGLAWEDDDGNTGTDVIASDKRDGEAEAMFSLGKLRNYTMSIPRPSGKDVEIELTDEHPVKFFHKVGIHHVTYVQAPRIATDQHDTEMMEPTECPFTLAQNGESAPTIEAKNQDGETVSPSWDGRNIVYSYPNDEGCRCSVTAKKIDEIAAEQGISAYGISTDSVDDHKQFAEKLDLSHTLLSDPEGEIVEQFGLDLKDNGKAPRATFEIIDGEIRDKRAEQEFNAVMLEQCTCGAQQEDEMPEFLKHFEHPSVGVVAGKRGSGKSSFAYRAGEAIARRRGVTPVTVGLPESKEQELPDEWQNVEQIDDAPPNSVVVVDEAYRKFSSRRAMSDENLNMSEIINLSRQCDRTILFVVQNTRQLDINGVSEADALFFKEPGVMQLDFERKKLEDRMTDAKQAFDQLPKNVDNRGYVWVYSDDYQGLIQNAEADFYGEGLSHSFAEGCDVGRVQASVNAAECPFSE